MLEWLQSSWDSVAHFFGDADYAMLGVWSLTICLMLVGLIGAVVPFLPGPLIIFIAGIAHTWLRPESAMSWQGIVLLSLLLVTAYVLDFVSGAMGAKWFGASRWGVIGVFVGGIVGLFFGLIGLIVGPLAGGLVFELLFAKRRMGPAVKSTWGTLLGTGVGLVIRVVLSLAMIATILIDALWL